MGNGERGRIHNFSLARAQMTLDYKEIEYIYFGNKNLKSLVKSNVLFMYNYYILELFISFFFERAISP